MNTSRRGNAWWHWPAVHSKTKRPEKYWTPRKLTFTVSAMERFANFLNSTTPLKWFLVRC